MVLTKYIEARFPRYFIFGEHPDGRVDVATANDSTIATMSRKDAEKIIADRDAVIDALADMANAFDAASPTDFSYHWYK